MFKCLTTYWIIFNLALPGGELTSRANINSIKALWPCTYSYLATGFSAFPPRLTILRAINLVRLTSLRCWRYVFSGIRRLRLFPSPWTYVFILWIRLPLWIVSTLLLQLFLAFRLSGLRFGGIIQLVVNSALIFNLFAPIHILLIQWSRIILIYAIRWQFYSLAGIRVLIIF